MGARASSASKKTLLEHKRSRPGSWSALCQLPATWAGHWHVATLQAQQQKVHNGMSQQKSRCVSILNDSLR